MISVEGRGSHLGDGLLQTVEGVDHGHVPPLALRQRADHLTGIALSAQLEEARGEGGGGSYEWFVHPLASAHVHSSANVPAARI